MKLEWWPRCQPWAMAKEGDLSVMSWNLLAPSKAEGAAFHLKRLPALLEVLDLYTSCDILCFQELEVGASLELVQSFLEEKGFDAAIQDREGYHIVNATFFRRARLRLSWIISRSRILLTGLLLPSGHEILVMNVHLDAQRPEYRISQLTKALQKMSMVRSTYQVVCGDFNADLASDVALCDLLSEQGLFRTPTRGRTHSLRLALDHLCSNETLMPVRLLCPASSQQLEGLPKQECPSDHLPVAATYQILAKTWHYPRLMEDASLPPELLVEWSELLMLGLCSSTKHQRKQQRRLEDAFLSSTDRCCSEALSRWRDTRQQAAKALCRHAVDQALVNVRAIAMKPNTSAGA